MKECVFDFDCCPSANIVEWMFKHTLASIRKFAESDDKIWVMWNVGNVVCWEYGMLDLQGIGDVGYWRCGMLKMWDVSDVGCLGWVMLEMCDLWDVGCLGCRMFRIWDVQDAGCLGCGMFEMWNVRDVGCSRCGMFGIWDVVSGTFTGMWDVDLQNASTWHYIPGEVFCRKFSGRIYCRISKMGYGKSKISLWKRYQITSFKRKNWKRTRGSYTERRCWYPHWTSRISQKLKPLNQCFWLSIFTINNLFMTTA